MAEMTKINLPWGYHNGLDPKATAAWGARAILETRSSDKQHWGLDIVPDRGGLVGPEEEQERIITKLNSQVQVLIKDERTKRLKVHLITLLGRVRLTVREMLISYEMEPNMNREFVLHEDREFILKANPQGSYGYLYIVAYFKPDAVRELLPAEREALTDHVQECFFERKLRSFHGRPQVLLDIKQGLLSACPECKESGILP